MQNAAYRGLRTNRETKTSISGSFRHRGAIKQIVYTLCFKAISEAFKVHAQNILDIALKFKRLFFDRSACAQLFFERFEQCFEPFFFQAERFYDSYGFASSFLFCKMELMFAGLFDVYNFYSSVIYLFCV